MSTHHHREKAETNLHEDIGHNDGSCRKKPRLSQPESDPKIKEEIPDAGYEVISSASLDLLFEDFENDVEESAKNGTIVNNDLKVDEDFLDEEITKALKSIDEYDTKVNSTTTSSSPEEQLFDTPNTISSNGDDVGGSGEVIEQTEKFTSEVKVEENVNVVNMDTISSIKRAMIDTSKFISTFTTLKTSYLKLCKEFNYLLTKFNDNEKIKIELIHENNELKNLLTQIITERELERKRYVKDIKK